MKNILHISDVHTSFNPAKGMSVADLGFLYESLVKDLSKFEKVDTIFITGDIAYHGVEQEYNDFLEFFLNKLVKCFELTFDDVFIAPGNHDTNKGLWTKTDCYARQGSKDSKEDAEVFLNDRKSKFGMPWQEPYQNFRMKIDSGKNIFFSDGNSIVYERDGFYIISINSAINSYDKDREFLYLTCSAYHALRSVGKDDKKIVLMHHPVNWLAPTEQSEFNAEIVIDKVGMLCYGHMHEHSIVTEKHFNEDAIIKVQAGKLDIRDKLEKYTGYTIISLDDGTSLSNGVIYLRRYISDSRTFGPWDYKAAGGVVPFSLEGKKPFNREEFLKITNEIYDELNRDLLCNVGVDEDQKRLLSEIFVRPSITRDSVPDVEDDDTAPEQDLLNEGKIEPLSIDDIMCDADSYFLFGGESCGKSTFLKYIAIERLKNQARGNIDQIVFYVDLAEVGKINSLNNIKSYLLNLYLEKTADQSIEQRLASKISDGSVILLLDSVEKLDKRSLKYLFDFIFSDENNGKIILGCSATMKMELIKEFAKRKCKKFKIAQLNSLARSEIRGMVKKWYPSHSHDELTKVTRLIKNVQDAGMAHNPFVYSVVLTLHEKKFSKSESYLHEADIVENFIEVLLQKHAQKYDTVPQYRDLILLLGYVAAWLSTNSLTKIPEGEFYKIIIKFKDNSYQDDFSVDSYKYALLESGIIKFDNSNYRFSQVCFYNYSLAYLATKDSGIENWLCCDKQLVRNAKAIEYYAAIKKNAVALIHKIKEWCDSYKSKVEFAGGVGKCGRAIDALQFYLSKKDLLELELLSVDSEMSQEDADSEMDSVAPLNCKPVEVLHDVESDDYPPFRSFVEAISLYSRVVRASDHILNRSETKKYFVEALNNYDVMIYYVIHEYYQKVLPIIVDKFKNSFDDNLAAENKELTHRRFASFLEYLGSVFPNFVFQMISDELINSRSKPIVKDTFGELDDLHEMFLVFTLCRLDDPTGFEKMKKLPVDVGYKFYMVVNELNAIVHYVGDISAKHRNEAKEYLNKICSTDKNKSRVSDLHFSTKAIAAKVSDGGATF